MDEQKSLRAVRLKFGAKSKEYMEATEQLQGVVVQDVNTSSSSSSDVHVTPFSSSSSSSSGPAADLEEKQNMQQRASASFVPPEL